MALKGVKQAKEELAKRRGSGGGGKKVYLKVGPDSSEIIRPLDAGDDFTSSYVHSVKVEDDGRSYWRDVVCLDQEFNGSTPCPGCEERAKISDPENDRRFARRYKFWVNVIWRDGPLYERDDEGKLVRDDDRKLKEIGRGDSVVVWSGGIRAAEELDRADEKYGGLLSRDFEVEREGKELDTKYHVSPPVDGDGETVKKKALTDADKKIADEKYDLSDQVVKTDYDNFFNFKKSSKDGPSEDPAKEDSPFRRKRNQQKD